jgi:hypothetical protein
VLFLRSAPWVGDNAPTVIQTIAKLAEFVRELPQASPKITDDQVTLPPRGSDGFMVWMTYDRDQIVISLGGWFENFRKQEECEAVRWYLLGISRACRLRVTSRGSRDVRWTIQRPTTAGWRTDSVTQLAVLPSLRRSSVRVLQNNWIESPEAAVDPQGATSR